MDSNVKISFPAFKNFMFFATLFLVVFSLGFRFHNFDYDLWARLIQGAHVSEFHAPLEVDFYSFTPTHTWYDPEWISSWIIYLIQSKFGTVGLVVFNCLSFYFLLCLIVFLLYKLTIKNKPCNLFYFSTICAIVTLNHVLISFVRCQIFTFILFALWLYLLETIRKGKIKNCIFLPFIMLFWLNTHGGCIAGVGVLFLYIIGEILNKKPFKHLLITFFVTCLMFLINPWGIEYIKFIFDSAVINRSFISEWNTFFNVIPIEINPYFYFLLFAIFSYIFQIFKTKQTIFTLDKVKLILTIVLTYLSIKYLKHVALALVFFSMFLFDDIMETLKALFKWVNIKFLKCLVIIFYFILFSYSSLVLLAYSFDASYKKAFFDKYPIEAMEFLKANNYSGKLFTHFHYGSFIGYKYSPNFKIHVDGRQEQVYYDGLLKEQYDFIQQINKDLILKKYAPDFIMLDLEYIANYELSKNKDYFLLYGDKKVNIYALNKHKKKKYAKVQLDKDKFLEEIFKTNVKFKKD